MEDPAGDREYGYNAADHVLLRISRRGSLLQKKLLVSSGNVPFDRSILIALGRAIRFAAPPLILIAGEDWVEVTMSFTHQKEHIDA